MSGETVITVIGNLTTDLELRYTQAGKAVANGTIAAGERRKDRVSNQWVDGDTLFMRISIWGEPGEHSAASLPKGTRVVATGRLKQRQYEQADSAGVMQKRSSIELVVDEIGPSMRYATANVMRIARPDQVDPAEAWAASPPPAESGSFLPSDSQAALV